MTIVPTDSETEPKLPCDIVMKGGITSGVVYPPAVKALSAKYFFRNIGGTSAGAIAAAAAAAAEYGRMSGRGTAFAGLEEISKWLGTDGNLAGLFQARGDTAPLLAVAKAGLQPVEPPKRVALATWAALREFELSGRACALLCLAIVTAVLVGFGSNGWGATLGILSTLCLGIVAFVLALVFDIVRVALRTIPAEGYGLCSGMEPLGRNHPPALSTWLYQRFNELAGLPLDGDPLTFGHLWDGPRKENAKDVTGADASERVINLEMLTTNLTHGRPYRLPFDERTFYFDPDELRRVFPEKVVAWMLSKPRSRDDHPLPTIERDGTIITLCPFPDARDVPVVVATRMSLSFPVLLSAVRLYALRFERGRKEGIVESCWFSDGGISSNFPIHFFDALLPRWPTFGINLRPATVAQADDVELARDNRDGSEERWNLFDAGGPSLVGFLGAIVDTMQNWRDNAQMRLPGYRDRVAHVNLETHEGGLNLGMKKETIESLTTRGAKAGRQLVEKFYAEPGQWPAKGWRIHRWVRYRIAMAALEDTIARFGVAYATPIDGRDQPYPAMPASHVAESDDGYKLASQLQARRAVDVGDAIASLAASQTKSADLTKGAPRSRPRLQLTSRVAG